MPRPRKLPEGDTVLRRAPFSDNPRVGARGQRAQQRILEAALRVFGDVGYHECGVLRITEVAGCSRAAFYQYFSSKEDVFRHLAGQVARQLRASAEAMGPITPDADGWAALRAWIERHGAIYDRYEPVFQAFQAAAESDEAVAIGASRIGERNVAGILAKVSGASLPDRHAGDALSLLIETVSRTHHIANVLRAGLPASAYQRSRVDDALTDVFHRTLFGLDPDVNVRPPLRRRPPRARLGPVITAGLQLGEQRDGLTPTGARTLAALLDAGHDVLLARGYHGTRVDDITEKAGVSHGAFYRYFDNKEHLIRVLAVRAMRTVSMALADIPADDDTAALRQWLRRYNRAHAAEMAMIRVWVDATADDPGLRVESSAAVDWGRGRLARFLERRGFGDVDTEAVALVAALEAFATRRPAPAGVDAAVVVVERGFLGRPGPR